MESMMDEMKLRGFSLKTIKAYEYHVDRFLKHYRNYSDDNKRAYLLGMINKGHESASVRLASAAIDFYARHLGIQPKIIPIPKKKKRLPEVLTKRQIIAMIDNTLNIKHQLIIEILYSAGLRLSELINLKVEDIDFDKNIIRVRQGKGSKDRITIIGRVTAGKIKQHIREGKVIKGRKGSYSAKSVQLVLEKAAGRADINRKVTPHMLRHSFATHLLEQGTDIRYIEALRGHERLSTTQIYTHVASKELANIKSPLD